MWLMQRILLCFSLTLALSSYHTLGAPSEPGVLHCGKQSFQFITNHLRQDGKMPVFIVWDHQGLPHRLLNNSECGMWVTEDPGGSVILEANYSGCYVKEWGFHYVLLIGVEEADAAGHTVLMKKRLLKCPANLPGGPVDPQALWVAGFAGTFIIGVLLVSYLALYCAENTQQSRLPSSGRHEFNLMKVLPRLACLVLDEKGSCCMQKL